MVGPVLAVAGLLGIGLATLTPVPETATLPFFCMVCDTGALVDAVLNVALFVPFGIGLRMMGLRLPGVLLAAFTTTLLIEATQFQLIAGRDTGLRDLLTNTLGGLVGGALCGWWHQIVRPTRVVSTGLALSVGALFLVCQAATTWALQPDSLVPPWWAQIAPDRAEFTDVFEGEVLRVSIGGRPISGSDRLDEGMARREGFLAGEGLSASLVTFRISDRIVPIVEVSDAEEREVAFLGLSESGIAFRSRRKGQRLGLKSPVLFARTAERVEAGDTVSAEGFQKGATLGVRSGTPGARSEKLMEPSASWILSLFLPVPPRYHLAAATVMAAVWLLAVFLALGYWLTDSAGAWSAVPVAGTIVLLGVGLFVLPSLGGLPPSGVGEWLTAVVGAGAGNAARRAVMLWAR